MMNTQSKKIYTLHLISETSGKGKSTLEWTKITIGYETFKVLQINKSTKSQG